MDKKNDEKLHEKELKLLKFIRRLGYGEVVIKVQDGVPVMIEKMTEYDIKNKNEYTTFYEDEQGNWNCSECDLIWCFEYGGPEENHVNYCPQCGRIIGQIKR